MKYLSLILILCSECLCQIGLSEKINSHEQLLEQKSLNVYNDVYNQENDVFEDPLRNNADLNLEENHVDESIKLLQHSNVYSFPDESIHPPQRADCTCTNGKCVIEGGKYVCKCPPGYGNYTKSYCKACECGPNKSCIWIKKGFFNSEKDCFCNPGYFEDNGNCVVPCTDESQCSERQKCVGEQGKKTCQCDDGLGGENCDKEEWCKITGKFKNCKGEYGKCEYSKEKRSVVCTCDNGKKLLPEENVCKVPCTDESQCSERQKCVGEEGAKTCQCDDGLGGENCDKEEWCEDTGKFKNCKGENGKCEYSKEKRSVVCTCDNAKTFLPEENICKAVSCTDESQCRERQKCVGEEGMKTCQCDDGLGGENCDKEEWCEDTGKYKNCKGENGKCEYSKEKRSVVCICDNGKKFVPEENICKGPCTSNPCNNYGKCEVDGQGFKCNCIGPWKGKTCQNGPCDKQPCQNGGTCTVGKIGFICKCQLPFNGPRCENGPCTSNPCKNNGTCEVYRDGYRCNCKMPFNGRNCETGPCILNPCRNDGICSVDGLKYKCECKLPFKGDNCETDPCSSNPCQNGGTCSVDGQGFKCSCESPFKGKLCEEDPCSSSPCLNGGKCKITGKTYSCDCPEDYLGERCQHGCDCKNGKCRVTSDENVLCECLPEFGRKLEVCEPCDCGTGANCTWEGSIFFGFTKYCLCPDGSKLKEQHCEDPCAGGPCKNGGKCEVEKNSFKCYCPAPFSGKNCETDPCTGGTCKNGGTCRVENNSFKCYCPAPFLGNKCETDPCTRGPCKNGGKCEVEKNSFKCYCPPPFSGKNCETDPCTKNPCENGGICRLQGNSSKCYCRTPYFGDKCQKDPCTNNPCKNGGNCSLLGDSFKCDCKDNFVGDRCEYDPCTSSPCLNNGNCTVNEHSFKCECKLPFFGDRCEKDPCSSSPCRNGGTCKIKRNSFSCDCLDNFIGEKCEHDPCLDKPCINGGTCRVSGNSFKCDCKTPYFGAKCEIDLCTINPCQNGGICRLNSTSFLCYCRAPYSGRLCESNICNADTCIHGKCEVIGQYYKCRCDEGFTGFRCEDKVQIISDKPVAWQLIQTSVLISILILLLGMFCFNLRRKK